MLKLLYIPLAIVVLLAAWVGFHRLRYETILSPKTGLYIQLDHFTGEVSWRRLSETEEDKEWKKANEAK